MYFIHLVIFFSMFFSGYTFVQASHKPDEVLVVASTRIPGELSEVARYCVPNDLKKFLHEDLGRRVTSIDVLPLCNGQLGPLEDKLLALYPHVTADARSYIGFQKDHFGLVFMELPPSCLQAKVSLEDVFLKENGTYKNIRLIPQIIQNLATSIISGGRLEIEHLPLMCHFSSELACRVSDMNPRLTFIEELIEKDPFTIYHTELFFIYLDGLKALDIESLRLEMLDKGLFLQRRNNYCRSWPFLSKQKNAEQAAMAELKFLDFFQDALIFRSKKEGVFPQVMGRLVAHEFKNNLYFDPNSYFRTILSYAHILSLRANLETVRQILEPLGFENIMVKVKKESYNGRINSWFIVAQKMSHPK